MVLKFERFFSPAWENRGIHLYLPDNYYESQERYPVLYMFDGHKESLTFMLLTPTRRRP